MIDFTGELKSSVSPISGRGGGGKKGGASESDENTLRSKARARLVEIISEGVIEGLVNGAKSIYFDQTPLQNADGSYNFKNVIWSQHKGTADDGYFKGHSAVETPESVEVQVKKSTGPVTRTILDENADAVRVVMRLNSLFETSDEGAMKKTSVSYAIDVRGYNGTWKRAVTNNITRQKAMSPVQIAHRIDLPDDQSPWDIRVTNLTDDATDEKTQRDLYWEGYVILVEGKFMYPHSAGVGIEVNAEDMGTSIPPRSYHVRGIRVLVPNNYDPITRTYTGIWNGGFKRVWTNNPAWIFYDLLTNDRYGLGEFISPGIVDKWSLYQIAQYCDQLVPSGFKNGDTGQDVMEPRFTYNGVINSRDEAFFVLQSITQAWRGMAYWAVGQVFATADMPRDPDRLVTPANVIGGEFEYSHTAIKARHSVIQVKWNDPDDFYRPATELVIDTDLLQKYGWREKSVQLRGCTSRGLAHRYGKWIIDTEQHAFETVTYSASWDHAEVRPGEIVAISNPKKAFVRAGGRVVSHSGETVILDADFDYTFGESYELILTMPNGQLEKMPILAFLDKRTIRVSSAYSDEALPDAVWTITGTDITPKLYRVISVDETEPNIFKITALFHDPQKYDRVEQGIVFETLPYTRLPSVIPPPTNLVVVETGYISNGQAFQNLTISWSPPENFLARGYVVTVDAPDTGTFTLGTTAQTSMEMQNVIAGEYTFHVQTIALNGSLSREAEITYAALGPSGYPIPAVEGLEQSASPGSNVFDGTTLSFRWKNMFALQRGGALQDASSPHYDFNTVEIYHNASGTLLRRERIKGNAYAYPIEVNAADCAAKGFASPARDLRVEVSVTDVFGRTSAPDMEVFTNPVPAAIAPSHRIVGRTIYLSFAQPEDRDYEGFVLYRSTEPNIDLTTAQPYYVGASNPLVIPGDPMTTYFFKIAAFDAFGKENLNYSTEFSITALSDGADVDPPAIPNGLAVTSAIVNGQARVTVSCVPNTEPDLAGYDIAIQQGAGNFVTFSIAQMPFEFDAVGGVSYTIKLRARDRFSNPSGYSDPITHVAALDTTPPGTPSNVTISAGLSSLWLDWDNPADPDLELIEVLENSTNDLATAEVIATVTGKSFARTGLANQVTRFYWLRAVDTSGNASLPSDPVSATTADVPTPTTIEYPGLLLVPNSPSANRVSWGSFTAAYGQTGSAPTAKTITAGNFLWTSGSLYLYYIEGETILRSASTITAVYLAGGRPIAVYRGGTDLKMTAGQVVIDGNNIAAGTIGASQLVTNAAVITGTAQIQDAVITSAKIVDLDAAKIKSDSVLAGTIQVGGDTLQTIKDRASDPASRINQGTTLIDPGLITISGAIKLSDWRSGSDNTKIAAGAFEANSIKANILTIGLRGITVEGITFEHDSPAPNQLAWTAGTIAYLDDSGANVIKTIPAGSVTWTANTLYVYWAKNAASLSTTTSFSVANADNNIILATYRGAAALFANYGRTIVDGANIKTGSISTDQLKAGSVTAEVMSVESLSAITSNIGVMISGMLKSSDDKMQIDLDNKCILIAD